MVAWKQGYEIARKRTGISEECRSSQRCDGGGGVEAPRQRALEGQRGLKWDKSEWGDTETEFKFLCSESEAARM